MYLISKKAQVLLISLFLFIGSIVAENPIVQTMYTADPAPMVYKDTFYIYTGHDEGSTWFVMNDWKCFSSTDMVNWTDHGTMMNIQTFGWAESNAWAGHVTARNGKFYFYAPVTAKGGKQVIGVAVSDSPTGPFVDAIGKPLVAAGFGDIDPNVLIDDDGQAYLYWGNPPLWYVKLNEDMISYSGEPVNLITAPGGGIDGFGPQTEINPNYPTSYHEAPWMYKRNGLYYMAYAAFGIPEDIRYSTATSPTGPFTYRGVIMPQGGGSWTIHEGIVDFKGKSYFVYHNGGLPKGGGNYTRSVCVEEFNYNADGTIPTINMTKTGVEQISFLNPYIKHEAEEICWEEGIKTETDNKIGVYVTDIDNGDFIKVKGVDFKSGAKRFKANVASGSTGGKIEIRTDSVNGEIIGICTIKNTNGWQNWETQACKLKRKKGVHDLYFKFVGTDTKLFNFNYWKFE